MAKHRNRTTAKGTYFHFVEVHLLNKFSIKHIILLLGDFIMNFIQIFGNAIPPLRHHLKVRFIRKRCNMELPIMGNKESTRENKIISVNNKSITAVTPTHAANGKQHYQLRLVPPS